MTSLESIRQIMAIKKASEGRGGGNGEDKRVPDKQPQPPKTDKRVPNRPSDPTLPPDPDDVEFQWRRTDEEEEARQKRKRNRRVKDDPNLQG